MSFATKDLNYKTTREANERGRGPLMGYQLSIDSDTHVFHPKISGLEARHQILSPTYMEMVYKFCKDQMNELERLLRAGKNLVIYDVSDNTDIDNDDKPFARTTLVKQDLIRRMALPERFFKDRIIDDEDVDEKENANENKKQKTKLQSETPSMTAALEQEVDPDVPDSAPSTTTSKLSQGADDKDDPLGSSPSASPRHALEALDDDTIDHVLADV